jgi:hypothetical protein
MPDFVANTPISGPRVMKWKMTWDLGGVAWSYDWGMFYNVSSSDETLPIRPPDRPLGYDGGK